MQELKENAAQILQEMDSHENSKQNNNNTASLGSQPVTPPSPLVGALTYASKGRAVFPCTQEKKPYTKNGFKNATTDIEQIKKWWNKYPDALIGMPTGSRNGCFVLDVDMPEGAKSLAALEAENEQLPLTRTVQTRSGGLHLYFKHVDCIINSVSKIGTNLDIRTDGGYVIVPPSKGYKVIIKAGIADAPEWLIKKLTKQVISNKQRVTTMSSDIKSVEDICAEMAQTPEGERNDKLNSLAYKMGIMAAKGEVDESALEKLKEAALQSGLPLEEVEKTSASGFAAGIEHYNNEDIIPKGFELRDNGIYYKDPKDTSKTKASYIAPRIEILARIRDELNNGWGIFLRWYDLDKKIHQWLLPYSILANKDKSQWISRLADEGYIVSPKEESRYLLQAYLMFYKTNRRATSVYRTGWYENSFVFPDTVQYIGDVGKVGDDARTGVPDFRQDNSPVGKSGKEMIVLQVQSSDNPYRTGGTLDGWKATIGKWAEGNSRLVLALCSSLAAPLIERSGHENFGFNITGKSSSGKSTALLAASSIWGKGSTDTNGYALSWNSTKNGLEGTAALHNDTLLALDEMGQATAQTISEAVYMLANGVGKTRSRVDGSSKAAKKWRCLILSTGEKGIAEKISEGGLQAQAGQLVRIVEIPADAEKGLGLFENIHGHTSAQTFADAIKQAAGTHYGHIARKFIEAIQDNIEYVVKKLNDGIAADRMKELFLSNDADGQVKRVAGHFGLVVAAGELAMEFGLVDWAKDTPFNAAKQCFKAWLDYRGGTEPEEDMALVEKVKRLFIQHGSSRFQDISNPLICSNRLGFKREVTCSDGLETEFYITPEIFRAEISNKPNAPRILHEHNLLIKGDARNYTRKPPRLPGIGNKRCYVFRLPNEYNKNEVENSIEERRKREAEIKAAFMEIKDREEWEERERKLEEAFKDVEI